jgi:putative transposase
MDPVPDNKFPKRRRPAAGVYEHPNEPILVFATACTKNRQGWLANAAVHQLLRVVWTEAGDWLLGRYVIMPDHLHFFAAPSFQCGSIFKAWTQFWKSQFTKQLPNF